MKDPLGRRVVRRVPQLIAGGATLVLLGAAVGAEAQLDSGPSLVAVPAAEAAAPSAQVTLDEVAQLRAAATERDAERKATQEHKKAEQQKAEEKKAAEAKAAKAEAEKKKAEKAAEAKKKAEADRKERASRNGGRESLDAAALGSSAGSRYTRVDLNARSAPDGESTLIDVLESGSKLTITERTSGDWRQISLDGRAAWVKAQYLVESKPSAGGSGSNGSSSGGSGSGGSGACASGSGVESGLQANAIAVHRAICNNFPAITSYGGRRADSIPGHPDGRAIDAMIPNYSGSGNALGWQVAEYVRANAGRLGVTEVIFDQKIWTTQRSGEGWRSMGNRGSDTANHRDHVHVTTR